MSDENDINAVHADLKESIRKLEGEWRESYNKLDADWRAAYNRLERSEYEARQELTEAHSRANVAEAALAEMQKPCAFKQEDEDSYVWYTDCGGAYWLEDGTPEDHYKFCPSCGHPQQMKPSHNDLLSPDQEDR